MKLLGNIKILSKILSVIILLSGISALITWIGTSSMQDMNEGAVQLSKTATHALTAARVNQNIIVMNRTEYNISGDPSPENLQKALPVFENEIKTYHERIATLEKEVPEKFKALLKAIKEESQNYEKSALETVEYVKSLKAEPMSDQEKYLREKIRASRAMNDKVREKLRDLGNELAKDAEQEAKDSTDLYLASSLNMYLLAGAGIFSGLLIGFLIGQYGISRPITRSVHTLQALANGDYSAEIDGQDRKDEVGEVARAAVIFRENGLARLKMEEAARAGEQQAAIEKKRLMNEMADSFNHAVGGIVSSVSAAATQLEASAQTLTSAAQETSVQSSSVAAISDETSRNVQAMASATEEMSISVQEITAQVTRSNQIAAQAVSEAAETSNKMATLSQSTQAIGDIVSLINEIAGQTNLLALNATIEAARAGDAGKGFAVVASEVKLLAEQTSKATAQIADQISEIQGASNAAVEAIAGIGRTIQDMNAISTSIAAAMEEQTSATSEISRNVQQAAAGTSDVSQNIGHVSQAAAETGSSAGQVLTAAEELSRHAEQLSSEVDKFIATVRAA